MAESTVAPAMLDKIEALRGRKMRALQMGGEDAVARHRQTGRLTVRLIGRNLTDEPVRREAADIALVGAHSVGVYPPRRFAAELGYRF